MAAGSAARAFATRVFPNFSVYGSDSAFQVLPNAPQYATANSGNYLKTKRLGGMMLSWAKATNSGYDYNKKMFFSLSPSEVGLVLELLDRRVPSLTLNHSPNMNAATETGRAKQLEIEQTQGADGQPCVLFRLTEDGTSAASIIDLGESRALRELFVYALPRLYGFHSVLDVEPTADDSTSQPSRRPASSKPAADWPF